MAEKDIFEKEDKTPVEKQSITKKIAAQELFKVRKQLNYVSAYCIGTALVCTIGGMMSPTAGAAIAGIFSAAAGFALWFNRREMIRLNELYNLGFIKKMPQ